CWGLLDDRASEDALLAEQPVSVELAVRGVQLVATASQRCVLDDAGHVTCWGRGCGDGAEPPRQLAGLDDVGAIAAGDSFACAVVSSRREVQCWGQIDRGRKSSRAKVAAREPASCAVERIAGLHHVAQLELGQSFAIAVTDDGKVYHWGESHYG